MRELSLFTGAGGGLLGTHLLGWTPCGYVEWDEYCQRIIAARIADGYLPIAPIFTDVREFVKSGAADQYRGIADVVTAGFPCQPFSSAGKMLGEKDPKNMWPATREAICKVQPKSVFLENVQRIVSIGYIGRVLCDLAELGYVGRWGIFTAKSEGAPHERKRIWICAHSDSSQLEGSSLSSRIQEEYSNVGSSRWWSAEPPMDRMANGMAHRVDRLKAIGNGQVPAVAKTAWRILS